MLAFLDFEASSLGKKSYPIEVAWVFEDGREASYLIRPAPGWTDWDADAEAIHHISQEMLSRQGEAHDVVAQTMLDALSGHDLLASAPSWDGKWLSALLRAAGAPRHSLRLRDTEEAQMEALREIISPIVSPLELENDIESILTLFAMRSHDAPPAHRALPDARQEYERWRAIRQAGKIFAERQS